MTEERKSTDSDAVDKDKESKKTAKPKAKSRKEHNHPFKKYVPPVINHKKVKPKQNDYDTVFAAASGKGVTGCIYVRGLAAAVILAVFVYASISIFTYGLSASLPAIAQTVVVFVAALAVSAIALVYAERFLQSNLASMTDGQYAAFIDQEEAIRGLVGHPEGRGGKAALKSLVQSLIVAVCGVVIGIMIQFPTISAVIAVFLLLGLSAFSSMFGSLGRIGTDSVRRPLDVAVIAIPLVSVFSLFAQCAENNATIETIIAQALIVSVLLTACSAIAYRTLEDGYDFNFASTLRTWRWVLGGGALTAFCGWMSGKGMLLLGLLIATVILVAVSFYLLHRQGKNIWG